MDKLNKPMREIIGTYNAASVATVNADGTPSVSPKATFVILDDACIAFGNIRSPGTVANLAKRPAIELNFIDVLTRRAVRVTGTGAVHAMDSQAGQRLMPAFQAQWADYLDSFESLVEISITRAELILSPAYDRGQTAQELGQINRAKLLG